MEKKTEKEKEIKEQEKEIKELNPTVTWENEFNKVSSDAKAIRAIKEGNSAIYTTNGRFVSDAGRVNRGYSSYISANSLSRLDTLGLIAMITEKRDVIEFTDKGKFFVRKLQEKGII